MPWKEATPMSQRIEFVQQALQPDAFALGKMGIHRSDCVCIPSFTMPLCSFPWSFTEMVIVLSIIQKITVVFFQSCLAYPLTG